MQDFKKLSRIKINAQNNKGPSWINSPCRYRRPEYCLIFSLLYKYFEFNLLCFISWLLYIPQQLVPPLKNLVCNVIYLLSKSVSVATEYVYEMAFSSLNYSDFYGIARRRNPFLCRCLPQISAALTSASRLKLSSYATDSE